MAETRYKIQNIRSNQVLTDGSPKLPTADQIEYGEIAVNYAKGHETLSLKNSENEIVALTFSKIIKGITEGDKILTPNTNGSISSSLIFEYDNSAKKIYLYGKDKTKTNKIGEVNCTDFIKDGVLDSVEVKEGDDDKHPSTDGPYFVFTWNTDAGKDPIWIPVKDFVNLSDYAKKDHTHPEYENKVTDVQVDGESVVDETTKIANIDLSGYASKVHTHTKDEITDLEFPIKDIQVDGESVIDDATKIANIELSGYENKVTDVQVNNTTVLEGTVAKIDLTPYAKTAELPSPGISNIKVNGEVGVVNENNVAEVTVSAEQTLYENGKTETIHEVIENVKGSQLSVSNTDKVLDATNGVITSNMTFTYDSGAKKIYLYGKDNTEANKIGEVDCSSFIGGGGTADGRLDKVEVKNGDEEHTDGPYLVFTFTAAASYGPIWVKISDILAGHTHPDYENKVTDVQVDGTTVLEGTVAKIDLSPYAKSTDIPTLTSTDKTIDIKENSKIDVNVDKTTITYDTTGDNKGKLHVGTIDHSKISDWDTSLADYENKVTDVQVDGTTVLDGTIAKIDLTPYATKEQVEENERVIAQTVSNITTATGIISEDGSIEYQQKTDAHYINTATSVHDATVILDNKLNDISSSQLSVSNTDKVLDVNNGAIVSDITISYDSAVKRINLYGKDKINPIGGVPCDDFIKDGMLAGAKVFVAEATSQEVEISGQTNTFTNLEVGKTYIAFLFKIDGKTTTYTWDKLDATSLVDVYNPGDGLKTKDGDTHTFEVEIDSTSESYLTVGVNGVKLSGLDDTFAKSTDIPTVPTLTSPNKTIDIQENSKLDVRVDGTTITYDTTGDNKGKLYVNEIDHSKISDWDTSLADYENKVTDVQVNDATVLDGTVAKIDLTPYATKEQVEENERIVARAINSITTATGIAGEDGSIEYQQETDANYINIATSVHDATVILDAKAKELEDKVIEDETVTANALLAISDAAGVLNFDNGEKIEYQQKTNAHYINTATSVHDATVILDGVVNDLNGRVNDLNDKVDGLEDDYWVDLGLPSGTLWAKCNLGAINPEDSGLYFQWGDTVGYYEGEGAEGHSTWATAPFNGKLNNYNFDFETKVLGWIIPPLGILPLGYDAATLKGGKMPTMEDFTELTDYNNTTNEWVKVNGVYGIRFTSKTNGNSIFIPAAGRGYDGSMNNVNIVGYVWSSNLNLSTTSDAYSLNFDSEGFFIGSEERSYGFSVRPVLPL